jgi:hypothetical protein
MAFELDDLGPTGAGSCHPDRRLHHLGATQTESDKFCRLDAAAQLLRELKLQNVLTREQLPHGERAGDFIHDNRWRMTQDIWSHTERIVQIDIAVDVGEMRPVPTRKAQGYAAETHIAVYTPCNARSRQFMVTLRLRCI